MLELIAAIVVSLIFIFGIDVYDWYASRKLLRKLNEPIDQLSFADTQGFNQVTQKNFRVLRFNKLTGRRELGFWDLDDDFLDTTQWHYVESDVGFSEENIDAYYDEQGEFLKGRQLYLGENGQSPRLEEIIKISAVTSGDDSQVKTSKTRSALPALSYDPDPIED